VIQSYSYIADNIEFITRTEKLQDKEEILPPLHGFKVAPHLPVGHLLRELPHFPPPCLHKMIDQFLSEDLARDLAGSKNLGSLTQTPGESRDSPFLLGHIRTSNDGLLRESEIIFNAPKARTYAGCDCEIGIYVGAGHTKF